MAVSPKNMEESASSPRQANSSLRPKASGVCRSREGLPKLLASTDPHISVWFGQKPLLRWGWRWEFERAWALVLWEQMLAVFLRIFQVVSPLLSLSL